MTVAIATKRAVAYRRVSTVEQAGERHSSLETQDAHIQGYCSSFGLASVASFTDVASGRRDDRAQYREMVKYVLQGGADVIVVQFLDRFGRNPREILRRVWELQENGVEVVASDEDFKEELVLLVKAGMAGQESKRNSERVRANMMSAASKGVHFGRPPYGYRRVRQGEAVAYEQDPAEAAAVQEMARLVVDENLGFKAIADRLTAGGFPSRNPLGWSADTVRRILANEALAGTLVFNKKPRKGTPDAALVTVPDYFPAILSRDQWEAMHARLAIRRENPRGRTHVSDYLLSGIVRCGHCGGPMVGKVSYAYKGRQYKNYWCSNAQRARSKCAIYNGHSAKKLEAAILEHLGQYSDPERVQTLLAATRTEDVGKHDAELRQVERRLADLDRDFAENLGLLKRGVLDEQDFLRANAARKHERTAMETRRADLAAQVTTAAAQDAAVATLPARVRGFLDDVDALETRKAKAILQSILLAAHVYRDGRIELEFRK